MAVRQLGRTRYERHVEAVGAQLLDRIAGHALGDLNLNTGIVFPILPDQLGKKAARDQGVDTYAQPPAFPRRCHTGSLHRMVKLIDADRYPLDEVASGLGQPDAACVTLEQEDTKVLFQRLYAGADAGLRHAKRISGMAEVQIFGNGERLDQGRQGDTRS